MNCSATDRFQCIRPLEVLVIGYGNSLRGDDGVGPAIASRLGILLGRSERCNCVAAHQLTPENAEDLLHTQRVIFIDAYVGLRPGHIRVSRLTPDQRASHSLTHHVSPATLLWMSSALFGHAPKAWLITIGVRDLFVGERLSPEVSSAATRVVRHLAHRLRVWSSSKNNFFSVHASKEGSYVCS